MPRKTVSVSIVDSVEFGAANDGETFGRVPNDTGRLAPLATNSLGGENGPARVGPLVMTELNYNPGLPSAAAIAADPGIRSDDLEFVEIHNPTASAVDFTNWQVRGGVDFDFDDGTMIGASETVVVIPIQSGPTGQCIARGCVPGSLRHQHQRASARRIRQ